MKKAADLFSYLKGVSVIIVMTLCLVHPGYAAEPGRDITLQWDRSFDDAYLQYYRIYYYTTPPALPGQIGVLDAADNAVSCSTPQFPADPCTPNGPITIDKKNTQIKLHFSDATKIYYFVVTAIDRSLESIVSAEITFKEHSLVPGLNVLSLSPIANSWVKAEQVTDAVGTNCLTLTKWEATASPQGFIAHIKDTPLNDFDIVTGNAYFVNVSGAVPFTIGKPTAIYSIPYNLKSGLNLVKMPDDKVWITKVAALATDVGLNCISIIKWDASKQGFVAHIKGTPLNNFDVTAGEGYFINVNADKTWQ